MEGNIIFDEGAQRSFITQELAAKLNLQPYGKDKINLASFGSKSSAHRHLDMGVIEIHTISGERIPISVLIARRIAPSLQNLIRTSLTRLPHIMGITLAHPVTDDDNFELSILIGTDYYWTFVEDQVIRGEGPTAVASKLGYLFSGPLHGISSTPALFHVSAQVPAEATTIEQFWNIESTGTQPTMKDPDKEFLESYMKTSITCQQDGSYSLKFPWKENHPILPANYNICCKRTRSLARRLAQTPDTCKIYGNIISEQLTRGFIEQVQPTSATDTHYILHHPVKKESLMTPIKIVYDCSCRLSHTHPSLNDCLTVGPTLLNDMCSILHRFRLHKYGISTDIEKAFIHVTLDEKDRDYTRFLWLSNPTDPESVFNTYRFKSVSFGSVSSPFMLHAALHFHLQKHSSSITTDIASNLYVGNVIIGCATETAAVNYYTEARRILSKAKFNLRSRASNSEQVTKLTGVHDSNATTKVLGLQWHTSSDIISLASQITVKQTTFTKREILQSASAIFDPLGFITPVTIKAKILLQQLWKLRVDWDELLNTDLQDTWYKIAQDITEATEFVMPRRYFLTSAFLPQELHVLQMLAPRHMVL